MDHRQGPVRASDSAGLGDRLTHPQVRDADTGELRPASWPEAFGVAARGLASAGTSVGVLAGGRLTAEDAYAYGKFARVALGTNDVDFRARAHSAEEAAFLAARLAGKRRRDVRRPRARARRRPRGPRARGRAPIVFLRLRKAAMTHGTRVYSVAPLTTRGLRKMRRHAAARHVPVARPTSSRPSPPAPTSRWTPAA